MDKIMSLGVGGGLVGWGEGAVVECQTVAVSWGGTVQLLHTKSRCHNEKGGKGCQVGGR